MTCNASQASEPKITPCRESVNSTWFDDDTLIPYLLRFHHKQARTLNRDDLNRWMNSQVVVA